MIIFEMEENGLVSILLSGIALLSDLFPIVGNLKVLFEKDFMRKP